MNANKTQPTEASVARFLAEVPDAERRADAQSLSALMERVTGEPAKMWGKDMVGFGSYRYCYESGREGEWLATGFSPRAKALVVYLLGDAADRDSLLARLGPYRMGKSCLYVKRLADIDCDVLEQLVAQSVAALRERYPE